MIADLMGPSGGSEGEGEGEERVVIDPFPPPSSSLFLEGSKQPYS